MKSDNVFKLVFPSRSCNEAFARTAVASFASSLDPTIDELADIRTAVSEAVTNCIVHAYRDTIGLIFISTKISGQTVTVSVRDRGCGIEDIERAMQPTFTTDAAAERAGLGFSVMGAFMDSLKVRSKPGSGTTVTMKKRIAARE
ncbi:MAG: anti-sigma F factor [Oscillospiraceae bacterium]|nr:anti-sigma F factor [Oscillospiraceae bacterium]